MSATGYHERVAWMTASYERSDLPQLAWYIHAIAYADDMEAVYNEAIERRGVHPDDASRIARLVALWREENL